MNPESFISNLDIILAGVILFFLLLKSWIFVTSENDNTPSGFFYNSAPAVHATNSKSLKKKKKLQNKLTFLILAFLALLIITLFFKLALG